MRSHLADLEEQLKNCQMDGKRFTFENERLLTDRQSADAAINELLLQLATLQEQNIKLESQLHEQAAKAEEWYEEAKAAKAEIEQLLVQSQSRQADPMAITLLQNALDLKANTGGAIKREIEKAISLLKER